MSYKVFTDFHHGALLHSLILLFEKRIGGMVYRPIGLEWFENGYWKINDQRDTAEQFLGMHTVPADGTPALNDVEQSINDEIYLVRDTIDGSNKAITLSTFYRLPIDLVIASVPQHAAPFRKLCDSHPNKPKLIFQIGNQWDVVDTSLVKNFMVSTSMNFEALPPGIAAVQYHQEFDTNIFKPGDSNGFWYGADDKTVNAFINVFQNHRDYSTFLQCEQLLPDWSFKSFGGQCRDGNMDGAKALAAKMREGLFVWHTKQGGDGYGHILHNAFAVGRPVIIRREDYAGKLGDKLLTDGQTAIFVDGLTPDEIVRKIMFYSDSERWRDMCRRVYDRFREEVDFDRDEKFLHLFLADLM